MIKSFKDNETEKVWNEQISRKFSTEMQKRALRKLRLLDSSEKIKDLRIPLSNCLEALSGNRAGRYSIRINLQWRICFKWLNGKVEDVEIVDYH